MRYFSITILLLLPLITFAQYTPLVNVPMLGSQGNAQSLNDYVNAIYALSISIAALLAVIKIIIAGVKWMTTDIVTTKGQAKKDIQGAVLGLLIIVGAAIIIAIINPNIGVVDWTPPAFSVSQPPPPLTVAEIELQNLEQCINQDNCDALSCSGSDVHGFDCTGAEDQCRGRGGTPNSQGVESVLLCINANDNTVAIDNSQGEQFLTNYMNEEGYTTILDRYAYNNEDPTTGENLEINQTVIDEWADDCEVTRGGAFVDISDAQNGVTIRACVQ